MTRYNTKYNRSAMQLPPDDQPDTIDVGPVHDIPIIERDDPRFIDDQAAWSRARKDAQARCSADQLLDGLTSEDWRVRYEVVDRLVARSSSDPRTLPALITAAQSDPAWQVRDKAVGRLSEFAGPSVEATLRSSLNDSRSDVRESAELELNQLVGVYRVNKQSR
jgi:HEAT repeat protein